MSLLAKSVIKNKCWIVEDDGNKIATILATPTGVTYVHGDQRENFASLKLLSDRYNIVIDKSRSNKLGKPVHDVYGYPSKFKSYNELWDVKKKIPIFTKTPDSKSYYCAGYYVINLNDVWIKEHCPKLITINRHPYYGPFKTDDEAQQLIIKQREIHGSP